MHPISLLSSRSQDLAFDIVLRRGLGNLCNGASPSHFQKLLANLYRRRRRFRRMSQRFSHSGGRFRHLEESCFVGQTNVLIAFALRHDPIVKPDIGGSATQFAYDERGCGFLRDIEALAVAVGG